MLNVTLDATKFAALSDELKGQYNLQSDGSYKLDLGGVFTTDKDPAGLFSALEKEREENKKLKTIADGFESDAAKAAADKLAADQGNLKTVEDVRAHFEAELKKRDDATVAEKNRLQALTAAQALDAKAMEVAQAVFKDNAAIMLPHVKAQLTVLPGDTPVVQVLDATTGTASMDQNFENFHKALSTDERFAPMVVVSKASGGSANGDKFNGLATTKDDGTQKTYGDFNSGELVRLRSEQPEKFQQLLTSRT